MEKNEEMQAGEVVKPHVDVARSVAKLPSNEEYVWSHSEITAILMRARNGTRRLQ